MPYEMLFDDLCELVHIYIFIIKLEIIKSQYRID